MLLPRPVSNSFDYVPERPLLGFALDAARCSARPLGLAAARSSRRVIVRSGAGFLLCRTSTRDFSDAEVRATVHGAGQLYLDVSGKLSIDDFARDVRQLVLAAECRRCPDLPSCAACYELSDRDRFAEDEAWLREQLARLEGTVLDVGLGQAPYLDAAAAALSEGRLCWHGIDPDPHAAAGLPVTLHPGGVEDLDPALRFDHALAIRSLGHWRNVRRGFERLTEAVRPGGTMLLVESLPLPLVRKVRHAQAAHAASAGGFQHYRNWSSERVLAELADLPWDVTFHRPVGRDTTDQWLLVLRRRG